MGRIGPGFVQPTLNLYLHFYLPICGRRIINIRTWYALSEPKIKFEQLIKTSK